MAPNQFIGGAMAPLAPLSRPHGFKVTVYLQVDTNAGPFVNEALLQVDCVTDRRLVQTLLHQSADAVIDCSSN